MAGRSRGKTIMPLSKIGGGEYQKEHCGVTNDIEWISETSGIPRVTICIRIICMHVFCQSDALHWTPRHDLTVCFL